MLERADEIILHLENFNAKMNATTIVEITLAIRAPPISRAFFPYKFFYLNASTHILAR